MIDPTRMLAYQRLAETGLSARDLLEMDMDAYARATGRPTPTQAALQALGNQERQEPPQAPEPNFATSPEPPGIDLANMDMATYAQFRQQAGIGTGRKEGRGIFDSVGSRSQAYTDATRQQAGRTGWSTSNVVEPPRLTNRHVNHEAQRDTRTAGERFGTPGNSNTF